MYRYTTLNHLYHGIDGDETVLDTPLRDVQPFLRQMEAAGFDGVS